MTRLCNAHAMEEEAVTMLEVRQAGPVTSHVDVTVLTRPLPVRRKSLAWRTLIVDLLKALDVDSSSARKETAKERYPGDLDDSAAMNIWLHKQMIAQLAANGGKLPSDIKH